VRSVACSCKTQLSTDHCSGEGRASERIFICRRRVVAEWDTSSKLGYVQAAQ
jgi:hypothetical protein